MNIDTLFDDENKEALSRLEAGSLDLLKRMSEDNLGKFGLNAINTSKQYLSPFLEKNNVPVGSNLLTNSPTSIFPFTGTDANGDAGYEYFVGTVACDDGAKVYGEYERDKIEPHMLHLFYEAESADKNNLFGNFYIAKMGDSFSGIIKNFLANPKFEIPSNIGGKKFNDVNSYDTLTRYVNSVAVSEHGKEPDFNTTYNAIAREYNSKKLEGKILEAVSSVDEIIAGGLSWCADKLENFLFTEADYTPSSQESESNFSLFEKFGNSDFSDLKSVLSDAYSYIADILKGIGKKIMDALPESLQNVVRKIQQFIQWLYDGLKTIVEAVLQFIKKFAEIIAKILLLIRAFLCGIVNGIIGLVQTTLRLLAFVIDMSGMDSDYQGYLRRRDVGEKIESVLDFIYESFTGIIDGVKKLFTQSADVTKEEIARFFETVGSFFTETVVDFWNNTSRYKFAYWGGIFIFEVLINVILVLTTGGAGNIARAGTYAEKLTAFMKVWLREAFSVATLGIVDILAFVKSIITAFVKACGKGLRGFFRWIEELIKGIKSGKAKNGEELSKEAENIEETIVTRQFKSKANGGRNLDYTVIDYKLKTAWINYLEKKGATF